MLIERIAYRLGALLEDPAGAPGRGRAGRLRALELYSWTSVAVATVGAYERAIAATQTDSAARTDPRWRTDTRGGTRAHR